VLVKVVTKNIFVKINKSFGSSELKLIFVYTKTIRL